MLYLIETGEHKGKRVKCPTDSQLRFVREIKTTCEFKDGDMFKLGARSRIFFINQKGRVFK